VTFDGAEIDPIAVVGSPGTANDLITRQLAIATTLVAAEMVGAMDRDFSNTVQYARDRVAFGRPIGSFQGIKHQLADTSLALEMSKAITIAAARAVGHDDFGPSAASMAKAFVGDAGIELVQTCFQVYGGIGYTWEHDQHLYLRRITTDAQLFGNANWHREHVCQLAGI
jgi:alkylation response protein AidB-like acyl-CoA dehydrogenase